MARRLVIISLFDVSASFVGSASTEGSCFTACRACSVMSNDQTREHEEISIKNRALVNKAYLKRSLTFNSVYNQRRYNKKCTICQLFEKWGPKLVWIDQFHYWCRVLMEVREQHRLHWSHCLLWCRQCRATVDNHALTKKSYIHSDLRDRNIVFCLGHHNSY